jgi:GT2 family glycosyltransferase
VRPAVSAVLVSYNTRALLTESVERLTVALANVPHEIIVVDNASPDGTAEYVRQELPMVRLIANDRNVFYTRAANQGIRAATGRYVLIVNPDVLFMPDVFARMYDFIETHPDVGAVSPSLVDAGGEHEACFWQPRTFESFLLNYTFLRHLFPARTRRLNDHGAMIGESRAQVRDVDMVVDMSLLVRREALDAIGLFDERFKLYFCDDDLSLELRKAGWRIVFLGDVVNRHDRHQSVAQRPEIWRISMFRGDALVYARKHFGPLHAALLAPLMRVTTSLRAVRLTLGLVDAR